MAWRRTNRHVPLIMGVLCCGGAFAILIFYHSVYAILGACVLLLFGWPSLKTAFMASDQEIDELTNTDSPMSKETKEKFEDRI